MAQSVSVVLDGVRSAENVGSIFRTCDAAGVSALYLVGITPLPVDRFGRVERGIAKSALGAEKTVPWEHRANLRKLIEELAERGATVIAVEQHKIAKDYLALPAKPHVAFVFGHEVTGLSDDAIRLAHTCVRIPMYGYKESLNVSVAVGIILFSYRSAYSAA